MVASSPAEQIADTGMADAELVRRAAARDRRAVRAIVKTHNQRLYRIARSVLRNDSDAEDAVQEAYVHAFSHLDAFRGDSTLSTWLTRIVINEALGRLRKKRRAARTFQPDNGKPGAEVIPFPTSTDDPERTMAQRQIVELVEQATDDLPDLYRVVFVARVVEGMSIEGTAELLGIRPETVKTRLHRARKLVRERLHAQIGPVLLDAFPFAGRRCERMTETVMRRLGLPAGAGDHTVQ